MITKSLISNFSSLMPLIILMKEDLIWSVDVYKIKDRYIQNYQPTLYYLDGGPERSFIFEELQAIQDL